MSKLQNPFPHIREQLKHKTVNIPMTCPLCGREAKASYTPKAIPFITIECPNCSNYAVQEDFLLDFDDAEHAYLVSAEMRHTQVSMGMQLVTIESADEIISKQCKLESENRSLAYLVWQYDQTSGSWDGWKEYIDLPAVAYCKDGDVLNKLTEKAVELGYLEVKDCRYKATVAGMKFSSVERKREAALLLKNGSRLNRKVKNVMFDNKKVFIVHGHDTALRQEIENIMFRAGLTPIVLAEEASRGMTIIEKLENYADVGFAIVLYTPCDMGKDKNAKALQPRSRQNVVFEHGFMVAYLGRDRVAALVEDGVETPGDISGLVYISLSKQNWIEDLFKEMRAAGIEIKN